jgi:murein DD-endopeptidase MepM/ murein hydrolase activator NlpD
MRLRSRLLRPPRTATTRPSPSAPVATRPRLACLLLGVAVWPLVVLAPPSADARVAPGTPPPPPATASSPDTADGAGIPRASRPSPAPRGPWGLPLAGGLDVRRAFDPPASAWGPGHRGVDLRGRAGTLVRAAGDGTVAHAGPVAGRGVVSIDHGALRTTYEPVRPLVSTGDTVTRGEPVGVLRRPGSHCTPASCLHWGLRRGETYLDPLVLLGRGPVRLLPVWGAGTGP